MTTPNPGDPPASTTANVADPAAAPAPAAIPDGGTPAGDPPGPDAVVVPDPVTPPPDSDTPPADAPPDPPEAVGAPEVYEAFTVPDGQVLDAEAASAFETLAKARNLSQADAQQMVDLASGLVARTLADVEAKGREQVEQWRVQALADPEVGGANFEANHAVALSAIARFGDADLKAAFEAYGLGNHPAFLRFAYRVGKAASESGWVDGQGSEVPNVAGGTHEEQLAARMRSEQGRRGA